MSRLKGWPALAGALVLVLAPSMLAFSQDQDMVDDISIIRSTLDKALDSLPEGASTHWSNARTGHSGTLKTGRTVRGEGGQVCRNYQRTWTFDGGVSTFEGLACLDQAGLWRVKNERRTGRVALAAPPAQPPAEQHAAAEPSRPPAHQPKPHAAPPRREVAQAPPAASTRAPAAAAATAPSAAPAPTVIAAASNAQATIAPSDPAAPEAPLGRLPTRSVLR
jgi:surface antigen